MNQCCAHCDKSFNEHIGVEGLCKLLQEAIEVIKFYAEQEHIDPYQDVNTVVRGDHWSRVSIENGTKAREFLEKYDKS